MITNTRPHQDEPNLALVELLKSGNKYAEDEILYRLEKRYSKRYFDEITKVTAFTLMLKQKMFPNAKEISESMAMFSAIRNELELPLNGNFNCVVVGDGHTPRTATLVAMRTNYNCYSIDPQLRMKPSWKKIKRLSMHDLKIQQMNLKFNKHTIIILPHSHVDLKTCLEHISAPSYTLITMDCCFNNSIEKTPDIQYRDNGVWSEKNEIKIWKL